MTLACILSATGFVVVASAQRQWHALLGIIVTSLSSGLGETSMLAYTAKFNRYTRHTHLLFNSVRMK